MNISKDELISLVKKEGLKQEVIGYDYLEEKGWIIPRFKVPEDDKLVPTMGGSMYYDTKTKKWDFIELLDLCELEDKMKTVMFSGDLAKESA